jgi:hypothetical protein
MASIGIDLALAGVLKRRGEVSKLLEPENKRLPMKNKHLKHELEML